MSIASNSLYQFSVLLGTILGIGMFGLPYLARYSGMLSLVFWLLLVGGITVVVGFCYARVIHDTPGRHRLPGYVQHHLGHKWKQFALVATTLSLWGGLLAYILLGAQFLQALFAPHFGGSPLFYILLFFFSGAALLYFDARTIARAEIVLLTFFIALVVLLFFTGVQSVDLAELPVWNMPYLILPYGAVLFSLWGVEVLPDAAELGTRKEKHLRRTYVIAIAVAIALYLLFVFAVVSMSGEGTSRDALTGLHGLVNEKVLVIGYVIGVIATLTSFLSLGLNLQKTFQYDYGQPRLLGLFSALAFPLALALSGLTDFLGVMNIIGALALGLVAIIILHMYDRMAHTRLHLFRQHDWLAFLTRPLMLLLGFGILLGLLTPFFLP